MENRVETRDNVISPKLRMAGSLILLGLLVELLTLTWNNPIAFVWFLGVGGLFIALGIAIYLLALVSQPGRAGST